MQIVPPASASYSSASSFNLVTVTHSHFDTSDTFTLTYVITKSYMQSW